jgi:hypothetical protein
MQTYKELIAKHYVVNTLELNLKNYHVQIAYPRPYRFELLEG